MPPAATLVPLPLFPSTGNTANLKCHGLALLVVELHINAITQYVLLCVCFPSNYIMKSSHSFARQYVLSCCCIVLLSVTMLQFKDLVCSKCTREVFPEWGS